MTKTLKTIELAAFFNISRQALKKMIDCGNLEARLLEKGYQLVDCRKEGRCVIYEIEEVVVVPKQTWEQYSKQEFPTVRKIEALGDYCEERLITRSSFMVKDISKKVGVAPSTVRTWDNILVEKGFLKDNGYIYFRLTPVGPKEITYQEYAEYWNLIPSYIDNSSELIIKNELKSIVESENKELSDQAIDSMGMCIKVKSYLVHQFTQKYNELAEVLKSRKEVKLNA